MSNTINYISQRSAPNYIMKFIKTNMNKLIEIYNKGKEEYKEGMVGFKCSKNTNKMDVFFMNEELILSMITKESWDDINRKDKKIFFVQDLDINSVFIINI